MHRRELPPQQLQNIAGGGVLQNQMALKAALNAKCPHL
ncbi:hypothetical protein SynROS8604_02352 [Synechococcus sp. ROS8604]|nr:hypothetical protein SynROS8604_02352 [Synechococcus sp. ROS8604]